MLGTISKLSEEKHISGFYPRDVENKLFTPMNTIWVDKLHNNDHYDKIGELAQPYLGKSMCWAYGYYSGEWCETLEGHFKIEHGGFRGHGNCIIAFDSGGFGIIFEPSRG